MRKKTFRVYFIPHDDGRLTGILLRTRERLFEARAPAAYGVSEADVYAQLERELKARDAAGKDQLDRYLWDEEFETRRVSVEVHPQAVIDKRTVVGARRIPLRLSYAYCPLPEVGYRVTLPRFSWWFLVESLEVASELIKNAVSAALLGEHPAWIYDFRHQGEEYVREWEPELVARMAAPEDVDRDVSNYPTVSRVGEDLVDRAARHKLPPLVGGDDLVLAQRDLFERDPPASILLVGGPGVGKGTFVRRMAKYFAAKRREKRKQDVPRIWSTSGDRIIAGMIYLGMWQQRCLSMIEELSFSGDYLALDRLTSILKAQPDGSSIGEVFLPAILAEEISIIAECTEAELERCRLRFPALVGAMEIVRVPEVSADAMPALLAQYQVKKLGTSTIHPQGLKRLVQHLDTFQRSGRFPGKGFRFLDWLAQDGEGGASRAVYYPTDISRAYSRWSGLPIELISDEQPAGAERIAEGLRRRVIGQDAACLACARVLARFKAGLNDPAKPTGSLLFVGPTGVGKTELAKQLARTMFGDESRMIRLDMSEYMLPGSSQRLLEIGEGASSLAEKVRQQPLSLILFDEIEKAHPEVFDALLGILGEGRLSDRLGRLVDFRMALIIMTSNLGARESGPLGIGADAAAAPDPVRAVRQHFRPEFFNRIDQIVPFENLRPGDIERIVELELDKLSARAGLVRRNLRLDVHPDARRVLAALGFHPTRGARPLKRVIEERLITPVAVRMAADPALRDRELLVMVEGSAALSAIPPERKDDVVPIARESLAP
jgi:ATP-dependent Clp protease ATP-binding subunit ClpC